MKNKKGFTLTEVLLAVLIAGIIGVALASLTTVASREAGLGRSKVMLRNNLSLALRQLRNDIHASSQVLYVRGEISGVGTSAIPLLVIAQNTLLDGTAFGSGANYITYCFVPGSVTTFANGGAVVPAGATDGGVIYRREADSLPSWTASDGPDCGTPATDSDFRIWLRNVKFIAPSGTDNYPVPYFRVPGFANSSYDRYDTGVNLDKNLGSRLSVSLVLELPSAPVLNDATTETFVLPNGFLEPRI